jgi:hypothetical protein
MRQLVAPIAVTLLLAAGCRTAGIYRVPRSPIAVPPTTTMAQVSDAIWAAGRREGWRVREVSPGQVNAEKAVRTHRALVRIDYDTRGFGITLLEADNLLYDGTHIHKAYNLWVQQLEKSIQDELRFRYP